MPHDETPGETLAMRLRIQLLHRGEVVKPEEHQVHGTGQYQRDDVLPTAEFARTGCRARVLAGRTNRRLPRECGSFVPSTASQYSPGKRSGTVPVHDASQPRPQADPGRE